MFQNTEHYLPIVASFLLGPLTFLQGILGYKKKPESSALAKALSENSKKVVLMTGASVQVLQLAKSMGEAGHRVILLNTGFDTTMVLSGFSKYIHKMYMITEEDVYEEKILEIWQDENIDWFLPMNLPMDEVKFKIISNFEAVTSGSMFSTVGMNNVFMSETIQKRDVFLKKCRRMSLPTIFDGFPAIENHSANLLQASRINGEKFTANVISMKGKPVLVQMWSSKRVVYSKIVHHQGIFEWIEEFASTSNLSGMLSFNFVVDESGQPFCSGCSHKLDPTVSNFAFDKHVGALKIEEIIMMAISSDDSSRLETSQSQPLFKVLEDLIFYNGFDTFLGLLEHGDDIMWKNDDSFPHVMLFAMYPFMKFKQYLASAQCALEHIRQSD